MLSIHPNARTTPALRGPTWPGSAGSPAGELAEALRASAPRPFAKWRKRGPGDCLDRYARPHKLPGKRSQEESAPAVCASKT